MPRIDIELTSASADGSWTWRAAGARAPRGVLDGAILPSGAAVGDQLKVEADYEVDGITIRSVVPPKEKASRDLLELIPDERSFEPVVEQRARRDPSDRPPRGDRRDRGDRPDRGDRSARPRRDRPARPTGVEGGGERRERTAPGEGRGRPDGEGRGRPGGEGRGRPDGDDRRRHRPHFTPPPEVPQRPKPKRLRPGKQHRSDVLAALPEEQRPIAELASQGMPAVRQRLKEDNARLRAEGKPEMPAGSVLKLAEDLLPRVRVADWLDRAEAAQRQLESLDLRDLRSVVAAADDPVVARDESTRQLAVTLKAALLTKQEQEQQLWLGDVEVALEVGRVIRALRLSSQPPKAGVPFPGALAERLGAATTASLLPTDGPDRWAAVLEAAAFSPIRTHVTPAAAPEQVNDDLRATVKRLGPLLPQIAVLFGVDVPVGAPAPKPLRPTPRRREDAKPAAGGTRGPRQGGIGAPGRAAVPTPASPARPELRATAKPPDKGDRPTESQPESQLAEGAELAAVSAASPVPVPESTPVAESEPEPVVGTEPESAPVVDVAPERVAEPRSASVVDVAPEPEAERAAEPESAPVVDVAPVAEPETASVAFAEPLAERATLGESASSEHSWGHGVVEPEPVSESDQVVERPAQSEAAAASPREHAFPASTVAESPGRSDPVADAPTHTDSVPESPAESGQLPTSFVASAAADPAADPAADLDVQSLTDVPPVAERGAEPAPVVDAEPALDDGDRPARIPEP